MVHRAQHNPWCIKCSAKSISSCLNQTRQHGRSQRKVAWGISPYRDFESTRGKKNFFIVIAHASVNHSLYLKPIYWNSGEQCWVWVSKCKQCSLRAGLGGERKTGAPRRNHFRAVAQSSLWLQVQSKCAGERCCWTLAFPCSRPAMLFGGRKLINGLNNFREANVAW